MAPAVKDADPSKPILPYLCVHNVIKAHAKVYRLYQNVYKRRQQGVIGIAVAGPWKEPKDRNNWEDVKAAERALQFGVNKSLSFA
jgi:lactase-phlorizin hydrolase